MTPAQPPRLFVYDDIQGDPHETPVKNINPYLVDAPNVLLPKRNKPLSKSPQMTKGSQPTDGGNLLLTDAEKNKLLAVEPAAAPWIRPFLGADEFINGIPRWCLWLKDIPPATLNKLHEVKRRVNAVKSMREASTKAATVRLAQTPMLFGEDRQIEAPYLLIPRVSSETRRYIPIGYIDANVVCSDANFMLPNASLYEFAILTSTMHNAWMRYTCGRLKSDFRYSNTIVYNNFPWPELAEKQASRAKSAIEKAAQAVLDARAVHQQGENPASLAILYNPTTMPANLTDAHRALDKAVDAAYGFKGKKTDEDRVAFLFSLYAQLTSLV